MNKTDAVATLAALAQETRLAIFRLLVRNAPAGLTAGVIAEQLELQAPTLSFHLKTLTHAGLVNTEQEGRFVPLSCRDRQNRQPGRLLDRRLLRRASRNLQATRIIGKHPTTEADRAATKWLIWRPATDMYVGQLTRVTYRMQ